MLGPHFCVRFFGHQIIANNVCLVINRPEFLTEWYLSTATCNYLQWTFKIIQSFQVLAGANMLELDVCVLLSKILFYKSHSILHCRNRGTCFDHVSDRATGYGFRDIVREWAKERLALVTFSCCLLFLLFFQMRFWRRLLTRSGLTKIKHRFMLHFLMKNTFISIAFERCQVRRILHLVSS